MNRWGKSNIIVGFSQEADVKWHCLDLKGTEEDTKGSPGTSILLDLADTETQRLITCLHSAKGATWWWGVTSKCTSTIL